MNVSDTDLVFCVSLFAVNLALGLVANDPVRTDSHLRGKSVSWIQSITLTVFVSISDEVGWSVGR